MLGEELTFLYVRQNRFVSADTKIKKEAKRHLHDTECLYEKIIQGLVWMRKPRKSLEIPF